MLRYKKNDQMIFDKTVCIASTCIYIKQVDWFAKYRCRDFHVNMKNNKRKKKVNNIKICYYPSHSDCLKYANAILACLSQGIIKVSYLYSSAQGQWAYSIYRGVIIHIYLLTCICIWSDELLFPGKNLCQMIWLPRYKVDANTEKTMATRRGHTSCDSFSVSCWIHIYPLRLLALLNIYLTFFFL